MNGWIRQTHRWLSIAFTACVIANLAVQGRNEKLGLIVGLATLVPLFLLLVTGLYMFALPYAKRWGRRADPV